MRHLLIALPPSVGIPPIGAPTLLDAMGVRASGSMPVARPRVVNHIGWTQDPAAVRAVVAATVGEQRP